MAGNLLSATLTNFCMDPPTRLPSDLGQRYPVFDSYMKPTLLPWQHAARETTALIAVIDGRSPTNLSGIV
jgi:hypothetical protein